jgi:hypothetical protein
VRKLHGFRIEIEILPFGLDPGGPDLDHSPREPAERDPLNDEERLLEMLRETEDDPWNRRAVRELLSHDLAETDIARLTDAEAIRELARRIAAGRFALRWSRVAPAESAEGAVAEEDPAAAEAPPAEPAPAPPEKTWVKFQVVDDASGKPVSGVKLKIKLPDGRSEEFTTNAGGQIYIGNLDPGSCDIEAMIDSAAYEVVAMSASER